MKKHYKARLSVEGNEIDVFVPIKPEDCAEITSEEFTEIWVRINYPNVNKILLLEKAVAGRVDKVIYENKIV